MNPSKRAEKIFEQIENDPTIKTKPDVVILANGVEPHLDASFFYISGFPYGLFERSVLLARNDGSVSVLTSPLEEQIAKRYANGMQIFAEKEKEVLRKRLKALGSNPKTIGVNASELELESYNKIKSVFKGATLVDVREAVACARAIKDQSEIEDIQKACDIASALYRKIPGMLRDGISESEIAAKMAYEMMTAGASGIAFDTIVAFGENSALPHYSAGQAKLRKGQFVLLDYGAKYRRYCSDITRTLLYGRASKQQKRIHEIVREALEIGTESCLASRTGADVDRKVTRFIDSTEYKGRFIHGTGHSLGLSVHDAGPGLSIRERVQLQPGMVMTVEPGIYVPGTGGVRIEDDVLITKGKPRVLTSAKRELIEV